MNAHFICNCPEGYIVYMEDSCPNGHTVSLHDYIRLPYKTAKTREKLCGIEHCHNLKKDSPLCGWHSAGVRPFQSPFVPEVVPDFVLKERAKNRKLLKKYLSTGTK